MSKDDFIKKVLANGGVMEDMVDLRSDLLQLFVLLDGIKASVYISEFVDLGFNSIKDDYFCNLSNAYLISNYLDAHPEHFLWGELFDSWLSEEIDY